MERQVFILVAEVPPISQKKPGHPEWLTLLFVFLADSALCFFFS